MKNENCCICSPMILIVLVTAKQWESRLPSLYLLVICSHQPHVPFNLASVMYILCFCFYCFFLFCFNYFFFFYILFSWGILFSHPVDYTPVCTTELTKAQQLQPEFDKRGVKMIAVSCDDVESHKGWINDIKHYTDNKFSYPIIADPKRELAVSLGMVDPDEKDKAGMPVTCRAVSAYL